MENNTVKNIVLAIILLIVVIFAVYLIIKPKETVAPTHLGASISDNLNNKMNELQIEVLKEGTGVESKNGDSLTVDYKGMLENGTKFDASADHGQPFTFILGAGQVIQGWDKGLLNMKAGEKRKLTIPSGLAYGDHSVGNIIPANATLIFEVELLKIN